MKMINFLENAKFGDKFIDNEGKIYIYHYKEKHKELDDELLDYHWLIREPTYIENLFYYHPYQSVVFKDGYGVPTNLKDYSIKSLLENGLYNKELIVKKL